MRRQCDAEARIYNCCYRGLAKTYIQHVLTAAGVNIVRLSECFPHGTTPQTRDGQSHRSNGPSEHRTPD